MTKSQISKIRAQIIDKYKDLNLEEVIGKIKNDVPNLIILVNDIKYNVKIKNKYVDREHRIIIFGEKDKLDSSNENKCKEVFMDVTFKITPLKFRPYKLLVIAGITEEDNVKVTKILSFVMIKYLDNVCYDRIFNYLYENFSFKTKIIHTDYEKALQ